MGKAAPGQRGFSIVEFATVIIILGATFIMTLKGAVIIETMKAIATTYQIRDFQNKIQQYLAEYSQLPGDDPAAPQRWGRPEAVFLVGGAPVSYSGNSVIQGNLSDAANATGEQFMAWRDLRLAGILDGDMALVGESARPENLFGGFFGFAEDNLGLDQVLCLTKIPGRAAQIIDQKLDDGNVATGRLRGTARWDPEHAKNHFSDPDTAPYDPSKTYIICLPYLQ